jgi:Flp pilus assembly protein TadG
MSRSVHPIQFAFPKERGLRMECPQWLRRARGERGSTLVETALSMVILSIVALGVMELSLALYTYHFLSDAAREGTRYAIVRGSSCTTYSGFTSACPALGADIQSYVRGLGFPGITPSLMTVTTIWPTTGASCTPSVTPCNNPGNLVQVTVSYRFPLSIPFVPANTLTMTSSSKMVISD